MPVASDDERLPSASTWCALGGGPWGTGRASGGRRHTTAPRRSIAAPHCAIPNASVTARPPAAARPLARSFNILKLPTYSSDAAMRSKLLTAIRSGAGFELS